MPLLIKYSIRMSISIILAMIRSLSKEEESCRTGKRARSLLSIWLDMELSSVTNYHQPSIYRQSQYNTFQTIELSPEDTKTILTAGALVGSLIVIGLLGSLLF